MKKNPKQNGNFLLSPTVIPPTGVTPAIGTSATGDTGHGVSATGTSDAGLCVGGSHAGSQDEEVLPVISISINDFQNPDNYNEDDYPGTNILCMPYTVNREIFVVKNSSSDRLTDED